VRRLGEAANLTLFPQAYFAGFLIGTGPPPGALLWPGGFFDPLESPTSFTSDSL
jgi:hypothetical protein